MGDLIGQSLGQYTLVEKIGEGGMATVYRATQASIGREVAVKVLRRSLIEQDDTFLERFYHEVQVIAKLQHPHILPVHDYGEHNGLPYIVMAYCDCGTLADRINQDEPISLSEAVRLIGQMSAALEFAHSQGIIHRDFKPSNVLIDGQGNTYLADFGLAKMVGDAQLTASGIIGTPDYMAPDWAEAGDVTASVDVYALGVTLYQMLTGEVPYKASTPMGVLMAHMNAPVPDVCHKRPDLSEGVQEVVAAAMAKTAAERYPTPGTLAAALEAASAGERVTVPAKLPRHEAQRQLYHPNEWARHVLEAAEEALGQEEISGILMMAGLPELIDSYPPDNLKNEFPFEHCGRIWQAIYEFYGRRGTQAVGKIAGQHTFEAVLNKHKGLMKLASAAMRVGSLETRISIGIALYTRSFERVSDVIIEVEDAGRYLVAWAHTCPICHGWSADEPVCYQIIGSFQAGLAWVSGGRQFRIVETECMAKGDEACVFLIDKIPIDE